MRELLTNTRRSLSELGQTLPPDTGDKLASVELQAEKTAADLEDQETEHKKAKNVRYEFQVLFCENSHFYVNNAVIILASR